MNAKQKKLLKGVKLAGEIAEMVTKIKQLTTDKERLQIELVAVKMEQFGEGVRHTEDRLWDFVSGKTNKPANTSFTAGKSRDIAYMFSALKTDKERLEKEKSVADATILTLRREKAELEASSITCICGDKMKCADERRAQEFAISALRSQNKAMKEALKEIVRLE